MNSYKYDIIKLNNRELVKEAQGLELALNCLQGSKLAYSINRRLLDDTKEEVYARFVGAVLQGKI